MTITVEIFQAFLQCETEAYLKSTGAVGSQREYADWQQRRLDTYKEQCFQRLRSQCREDEYLLGMSFSELSPKSQHRFVLNCLVEGKQLQSRIHAVERLPLAGNTKSLPFCPIRFVPNEKVMQQDKLLLAFDALVLTAASGKTPAFGKIVYSNKQKTIKISLPALMKTVQERIQGLEAQKETRPRLILNDHCQCCEYHQLCEDKAKQEDNISLLSSVTPKMIGRYSRRGILTVQQLSYLFKPRKRNSKSAIRASLRHNPELQALAIRNNKIYLQEQPTIARQPIELFLDVEGIPDQQFYYLIGLMVCQAGNSEFYSYWANDLPHEEQVWKTLLEILRDYPTSPIYHYGSYEVKMMRILAKRYKTEVDDVISRLINVNSYIYGKIYFPVRSNGLKDIGKHLGAYWSHAEASGLQSLIWRDSWEETQDQEYKTLLETYNKEDCMALKRLCDEISQIKDRADKLTEVDFAQKPKTHSTPESAQISREFETLLEFAHANYDKKKICFRQHELNQEPNKPLNKPGAKTGYQGQRQKRPRAGKTIHVPDGEFCPVHGDVRLRPTEKTCTKLIIDLHLTKTGMRKSITEYRGLQGYCSRCHRAYNPPDILKYRANQLYGHGFKAWVVYMRVALRMTYGAIEEMLDEQFHERELYRAVSRFLTDLGQYYVETENTIVQLLLQSPFIHADETSINIRGENQYVWVFTDGRYVIFKLRKTREATIVHEFLADYSGILVSDFYPGYDAVQCRQQKCWVHLIRDMNDDLRSVPFDAEFGGFVMEVRNLIIPIMEALQKYGLKPRHLNHFKKNVESFYKKVIIGKTYKSEFSLKYQQRFIRYRESLFTFLDNGVPWHNNTAENAIRHVAKQRSISGSLHEAVTHDYLRLLGIRQACRFQRKSFLKFLFSEGTNIQQIK